MNPLGTYWPRFGPGPGRGVVVVVDDEIVKPDPFLAPKRARVVGVVVVVVVVAPDEIVKPDPFLSSADVAVSFVGRLGWLSDRRRAC